LLEVEIGEQGDDRADLFQVVVGTPEGLRNLQPSSCKVLTDRATLILSEFTWPDLHKALREIVIRCTSNNWNESVLRLQRYFRWEYEDYARDGDLSRRG
jgi:hypothetical protein